MKNSKSEYNYLNKEMEKYLTEDEEAERQPTGAAIFWSAFFIIIGSLVVISILYLLR